MGQPKLAGRRPAVMELDEGQYAWCACGMSGSQPFCDGSHRGSEFTPVKWVQEETEVRALCMCKRTGTPPYCDGTHNTVTD